MASCQFIIKEVGRNAVTIEACMPLKGPPSNEKGDVELHGIPVQLGPSLPTLVSVFIMKNTVD